MELFRDVININLVGTFNVLTQAAEKMAANEPGEDGERGPRFASGVSEDLAPPQLDSSHRPFDCAPEGEHGVGRFA